MNQEKVPPEDIIAIARQSWVQRNPAPLGEAVHKIPFVLLPLVIRQALQVQKDAVMQKAIVKELGALFQLHELYAELLEHLMEMIHEALLSVSADPYVDAALDLIELTAALMPEGVTFHEYATRLAEKEIANLVNSKPKRT